jgi:hypothetical protein
MRSGHYDHLQMKSITPRDELDRMMAAVVMLASKMEFTEIELQVCLCCATCFKHALMRPRCRAISGTTTRWPSARSSA